MTHSDSSTISAHVWLTNHKVNCNLDCVATDAGWMPVQLTVIELTPDIGECSHHFQSHFQQITAKMASSCLLPSSTLTVSTSIPRPWAPTSYWQRLWTPLCMLRHSRLVVFVQFKVEIYGECFPQDCHIITLYEHHGLHSAVFHLRFESSVQWMDFLSLWMDISPNCKIYHSKINQAFQDVIEALPCEEDDTHSKCPYDLHILLLICL